MLPVNVLPVHSLTIPSTNQTFKFRPFLVKEEKSFLIAQQTEDTNVMYDTVKNAIKACAMSDIDVDKLASFDIEYIFIKLRCVSVGEIVDLIFRCEDDHGEDNKKAKQLVHVNLEAARVDGLAESLASMKIELFDNVGVQMKYPNIETLKKIEQLDNKQSDYELLFDILVDCIDYIYSETEVYYAKDHSKDELKSFLNNLTSNQFGNIEKFLVNLPKVKIDVSYSCPICEKQFNRYLQGITSFF